VPPTTHGGAGNGAPPDNLGDVRAALAALTHTVERHADGRDADAAKIERLREQLDAIRFTVDDPVNQNNLRDTTTRLGSRVDGHDAEIAALRQGDGPPPSGAAGVIREGATQARSFVTDLTTGSFGKLLVLGLLTLLIVLAWKWDGRLPDVSGVSVGTQAVGEQETGPVEVQRQEVAPADIPPPPPYAP
jgi:hypothetical protein